MNTTTSSSEKRKPVYQVKKSWMGISDRIVDQIGVRPKTWNFILKVFRLIVRGSKHMEEPVFGPIYKHLMKFSPEETTYSHGTVLNLNVDVSEQGETKVLPVDLVKDMLRKASYIASAKVCLCRDANSCQNYPKDVCCLFLSNSGRTVVDHEVGYEISLEDALARVDKAAELGLIGQALWVEVEQYIWGFTNKTMENFVEMCFCCPCCCVAFNISKNASRDVKKRFRPSGWTALVDTELCVGCGECIQPCPQAAITMGEDGKVAINQDYCVGCGICKSHCAVEAIKIKQTMPMRASIQEYFLEEGRLDLKI